MNQKREEMRTFARWKNSVEMVPIILALEKDRLPTLCAVFPAESETDPVFWRTATQYNTANTIRANTEWMFTTGTFEDKPRPVAVLVGIPADVFFTALSGRLFGDLPSDARGETAAIFRLALTLLPGNPPMNDILSVVGRYKQGAWPLLGVGRIPNNVAEKFAHWLPLPELPGAFETENNNELNELLTALITCPSGHSAYRRPPPKGHSDKSWPTGSCPPVTPTKPQKGKR